MERRTITVFDKSKEFQKIEQNKCNEMIINDILNPLLRIIYALRESDNFNNIPETDVGEETGWEYYRVEFNNIYRAINCNLFLSEYQYREIYKTVQGIHSYTRKFSGADGLQDFFFEANENLHYYTFAFSEDGKRCKNYLKFRQDNAPTENEYSASEVYHAKNTLRNDELNLRFEEEDFFVEELAYAVRVIFINIMRENERESKP
ncbi:hypothetical protein [uncultured Ruminococcus sp.]|jgi:hypothetical protein|uniref:hypothetical protein n=1 Tax=uncultured Ruminococcus sp. TaxID=165186 RepID=UPI0025EDEF3A|nr:hypothetical protein [uncultured Ruminococcus sp.]